MVKSDLTKVIRKGGQRKKAKSSSEVEFCTTLGKFSNALERKKFPKKSTRGEKTACEREWRSRKANGSNGGCPTDSKCASKKEEKGGEGN